MSQLNFQQPSGGTKSFSFEDTTTNDVIAIPSAGVGKTLQVVSKLITAQYAQVLTANVETEVAGAGVFTLAITPKGNNSKFKIYVRHFGEVAAATNVVFNVLRDSVRINAQSGYTWSGISMGAQTYAAANDSSTPEIMHLQTLDVTGSTAGTTVTYVVTQTHDATTTQYTNRCIGSTGTNGYETGSSEIIIEEIGA